LTIEENCFRQTSLASVLN